MVVLGGLIKGRNEVGEIGGRMGSHFVRVRVLVGLVEASNRSKTRARLPTHGVKALLAEYFFVTGKIYYCYSTHE